MSVYNSNKFLQTKVFTGSAITPTGKTAVHKRNIAILMPLANLIVVMIRISQISVREICIKECNH